MRTYGALNPIDDISLPPDTCQTFLLAAGTAQAQSYPNSTGGAGVSSTDAGAQLVRFSGHTTAGISLSFVVCLQSTNAQISSGSSFSSTSGVSIPVNGTRTLQVPGGSTGYSVVGNAVGYVFAEFWKK